MNQPHRVEHDLLGDRKVLAEAYYGVHTPRAVENFLITGTPISIYPDLIRANCSSPVTRQVSAGVAGLRASSRQSIR